MSDDNVIPFKPKAKETPVESNSGNSSNLNYTFSVDGMEFSFSPEGLDQLVSDMVVQDTQLDALADACFDLQCLVEEYPEIAQFVTKNVIKMTENMQKRLTDG
jgi:hypothetical protein